MFMNAKMFYALFFVVMGYGFTYISDLTGVDIANKKLSHGIASSSLLSILRIVRF